VSTFEGNKAETKTMLPVIEAFMAAHQVPDVLYAVDAWRREHPGEEIPDGRVFTQPWPAGPKDKRRDQVIYYTYRADRARRTLHGIDEQAAKAVAGLAPVKRNRFIQLEGAVKSVNRGDRQNRKQRVVFRQALRPINRGDVPMPRSAVRG
jgi:hypothetical protein